MPNRILKESICTSESIDSLTEFQEVFFYRLLVNCDDFGRFDARPKILSSRLFPLRPVAAEKIEDALSALLREGMIQIYSVGGKDYLQVNAWLHHQNPRAKKSKYPSPPDSELKKALTDYSYVISDDITCNQIPEDAPDIRYSIFDNDIRESDSDSLIADEAAHEIRLEQDRVLDAAIDAGFPPNNTVRAQLIQLYSEHGLDKMLNGISECATHSASSIAYLKAVLNGSGKRRRAKTPAQDFPQRDYSNVQDTMMSDLEKEIAAMREGS